MTVQDEFTPALYNNPELSERLTTIFTTNLGKENVVRRKPEMIGEDFGRYGRTTDKIPICMFRVGTAQTTANGIRSQSLHTATFAPDPKPTLTTAVQALTAASLNLLMNATTSSVSLKDAVAKAQGSKQFGLEGRPTL